MPWVVGLDEAGYGPNLGPLVQAAVALELPNGDAAGWATLPVRRVHEPADGRFLADDSKKVYAGPGGFAALAAGVRPLVGATTLGGFLAAHGLPDAGPDAAAEAWFAGDELLSLEAVAFPVPLVCVVNLVQPPRFNGICDETGTKAAVLARGAAALMRAVVARVPATEPLAFLCDKHGGRNFYAGLVQDAFPDGWPVADRESAAESRYRVLNLDRAVSIAFRPRADAEAVPVALASMLAKFLREVCMRQFNAYWAERVPGLVPTAGYPADARRYYAAIRPAMLAAGLPAAAVWRAK